MAKFINKCKNTESDNNSFWSKIVQKTNERSQFKEKSFVTKLEYILKEANIFNNSTFYHGDLHFNNDFRSIYSTLLENWMGLDAQPIVNGNFEKFAFV